MADMYSNALCKGCLPNTSDSITTLLAKKTSPQSWGDTRPITLSCTALKVLAQLLLGRARGDLVDPTGMQLSERGKQTGEVIFALRRISRMALEWESRSTCLNWTSLKRSTAWYKQDWVNSFSRKWRCKGVNHGRLDSGYNWSSVRNCWCKQMEGTCLSSKQTESDKGHRTHQSCLLHSWEKPLGTSWNTPTQGNTPSLSAAACIIWITPTCGPSPYPSCNTRHRKWKITWPKRACTSTGKKRNVSAPMNKQRKPSLWGASPRPKPRRQSAGSYLHHGFFSVCCDCGNAAKSTSCLCKQ